MIFFKGRNEIKCPRNKINLTWISVMSRGALAFQATAALQVMLLPLVAFNWFINAIQFNFNSLFQLSLALI